MIDTSKDEKFWAKVDIRGPDECWPWLGAKTLKGYGQFTRRAIKDKPLRAHRYAWELANGLSIPSNMEGCHKCDNPSCCNPGHIWPGTRSENAKDAVEKGRVIVPHKIWTHCSKGHSLDGDNILFWEPTKKNKRCRTCVNERARMYYYRRIGKVK